MESCLIVTHTTSSYINELQKLVNEANSHLFENWQTYWKYVRTRRDQAVWMFMVILDRTC